MEIVEVALRIGFVVRFVDLYAAFTVQRPSRLQHAPTLNHRELP